MSDDLFRLRLMIGVDKATTRVLWVEPCRVSHPDGIETTEMVTPRPVANNQIVATIDIDVPKECLR